MTPHSSWAQSYKGRREEHVVRIWRFRQGGLGATRPGPVGPGRGALGGANFKKTVLRALYELTAAIWHACESRYCVSPYMYLTVQSTLM